MSINCTCDARPIIKQRHQPPESCEPLSTSLHPGWNLPWLDSISITIMVWCDSAIEMFIPLSEACRWNSFVTHRISRPGGSGRLIAGKVTWFNLYERCLLVDVGNRTLSSQRWNPHRSFINVGSFYENLSDFSYRANCPYNFLFSHHVVKMLSFHQRD